MLAKEEIQQIIEAQKEIFPTKIETNEKFAKLVTLEEFDQSQKEIKEDINNLREQIQALTTSVDGLVKFMKDSRQEEVMAKLQKERYERWFHLIADKLGIKLEY